MLLLLAVLGNSDLGFWLEYNYQFDKVCAVEHFQDHPKKNIKKIRQMYFQKRDGPFWGVFFTQKYEGPSFVEVVWRGGCHCVCVYVWGCVCLFTRGSTVRNNRILISPLSRESRVLTGIQNTDTFITFQNTYMTHTHTSTQIHHAYRHTEWQTQA